MISEYKRAGIRIRTSRKEIADIFGVKVSTVEAWVRRGAINLRDLVDIIDKYNNRHKLDKRRKQGDTHVKALS